MTFSTLITTHAQTEAAFKLASEAVRTHQNTCASRLVAWLHDILPGDYTDKLTNVIMDSGGMVQIITEPYHQTAWWNRFRHAATTDYVILSSADVIFHPGWFSEIEDMIARHPGHLSYHPVSLSLQHVGLSYIKSTGDLLPGHVHITANPLCHVIVSPTQGGHEWDEQFPYWEADMDFHLTMERGLRKACVCRGSRVDHVDGSVIRDCAKNLPSGYHTARKQLEKKWGLSPLT